MTTETAKRRVEDVEIRSAAAVAGNHGPQWQLEAMVSWSMYPIRLWIDAHEGDSPPHGVLQLTLERGKLREGRDAEQEYNYHWRVVASEGSSEAPGATPEGQPYTPADTVPAEAPVQTVAKPTYQDSETRRQASIERQKSLAEANIYGVARGYGVPETLEVADAFYAWLRGFASGRDEALEADHSSVTTE